MSALDLFPTFLAGVALLLALAQLAQTLAQGRSRAQLQRDLARIFERLDSLAQGQHAGSVPVLRPAHAPADDYSAVAELIAHGADARELGLRCGIAPAEARILIAMRGQTAQQAVVS
jgi:hypothetical protein